MSATDHPSEMQEEITYQVTEKKKPKKTEDARKSQGLNETKPTKKQPAAENLSEKTPAKPQSKAHKPSTNYPLKKRKDEEKSSENNEVLKKTQGSFSKEQTTETDKKKSKVLKGKKVLTKVQKSKRGYIKWTATVFVLSFFLSAVFSLLSELALSGGNLVIAFSIVTILLLTNILFDIIGVAAASCNMEPFIAKSSRKDKTAIMAIKLLKHAEKVSSVCNDVVGDICGIVSGVALGAILIILSSATKENIILSIILSSILSAFTVGGKAMGKKLAMEHNVKIIGTVAKILAIFKK